MVVIAGALGLIIVLLIQIVLGINRLEEALSNNYRTQQQILDQICSIATQFSKKTEKYDEYEHEIQMDNAHRR